MNEITCKYKIPNYTNAVDEEGNDVYGEWQINVANL